MAEGSVEEENGEMLGPSGASMSLHAPSIPAHLSIKDEDSDCTETSSVGSPSPATADCTDLSLSSKMAPQAPQDGGAHHSTDVKMTAHGSVQQLNGNMASLATLQNLASLHQTLPQVASLASHLSCMANMQTSTANGPLNLSVNSSSAPSRPLPCDVTTNLNAQAPVTSSLQPPPPNHLLPSNQPAPMPQLILASGQLVQGIQGAQLLIPTSQGLATQTILTIPVNHINSSDQMVNLALNNGQVMQTSLASLQAMATQSNLINPPAPPTNNGLPLLQPLPPAPHPLLGQSQLYQPQAAPLLAQAPPPASQTPPHRLAYPEAKPTYQTRTALSPGGGRSSAGASETSTLKRSSPSSLSPCNDSSTADLLIDSPNQPTINQTNSNVVDGINLDEIKDFAKAFKLRRLSLGLTQTQVGQALSVTEGPAYSQSAICSALASQMVAAAQQQAMFEKLDITPKSAQKIKPVLERWMKEAEERYKSGQNHLTDFIGIEPSKKRKRRTSFTPQALELLNAHFERNTHPSGTEITGLAHQLGYEREVIRIWFCNKRQALKNTVRMMSKGMV